MVRQMEVTTKKIGENTYYIKPFPAFLAANISGELAGLLAPMLGALSSLAGGAKDVSDIRDEDALPALGDALSTLSGDRVERLIKKLLTDNKNVSVEAEATDWNVRLLTYDLANEVFCGEVQDMYLLCWEVIKLNFSGFFRKLGIQSGSQNTPAPQGRTSSQNTEN